MVLSEPICVVMNDSSGPEDQRTARDEIEAALRASGRHWVIFAATSGRKLPDAAADAVALAARENGIVVAAGGDGTINAVAAALLQTDCAMGVLPQGSFNYFARVHDLPADLPSAMKVWLEGSTREVQVGQVNGHPFLVNASLGLYPRVLAAREADNHTHGRRRPIAAWSALRAAWTDRRALRLTLDADGQKRTVRTPTLFVGNNALQLEQLGFNESLQGRDKGRLAAITVRPVGLAGLVWLACRAAVGDLARAGPVFSRAFRRLHVTPHHAETGRRVQIACDGELRWVQSPVTFAVARRRIRLLVPRAPAGAQRS